MSKQQVLFSERSLEQLVGQNILHDSKTAIIELIANAWDAGAGRVDITWPENEDSSPFSIKDNGCGLSKEEFAKRWMQVGYNRLQEQGQLVNFPDDLETNAKRRAFGRNGLGRFAAFCFGTPYYVCTSKGAEVHSYKVESSRTNLLDVEEIPNEQKLEGHGTIVYVKEISPKAVNAEDIKTEVGMRFLTDPLFKVYINGEQISFLDVPDTNKQLLKATVDGQEIEIIAIDVHNSDRTTYQHGVAWHVNGRLVGDCSWKGPNAPYALDGRKTAAKRFTFIVKADCLDQEGFILPDWSAFHQNNSTVRKVFDAVHEQIKKFILSLSKEERRETFEKIRSAASPSLKKLGLEQLETWYEFVHKLQEDCPSLGDYELEQVAKILASLEASKSQYCLLSTLAALNSDQLDDLDKIMNEWTLSMAKAVLDEIQNRLLLVHELALKVNNKKTDEVKELQPLFAKSLWIFGPEFETIEYTSNEGMTSVIRKLMNSDEQGSRNRPDFVILPDGSCSLYALPRYDYENAGAEVATDKLVILELKKPSVPISQTEKDQPLKYIEELDDKGLIDTKTKIMCFVLGKEIKRSIGGVSTHQDGRIRIYPMSYQTVINNAQARLLNLHKKVKNAPFLNKQEMEVFISRGEETRSQAEMNV